jgi:hypothetical protein
MSWRSYCFYCDAERSSGPCPECGNRTWAFQRRDHPVDRHDASEGGSKSITNKAPSPLGEV